jgi:hypothetical protein
MRRGVHGIAIVAALLQAGATQAACTQERARYIDSQGVYELTFAPVDPEASASSHTFKMTVKDTKLLFDGYVLPSEPVDRTNGVLFNNCPEGDITGDDIAACTVWQGIVYANGAGKIGLLPKQGEPAAAEILLPGFGPSLQASSAWGKGKATVAPWDVLVLKGCSS